MILPKYLLNTTLCYALTGLKDLILKVSEIFYIYMDVAKFFRHILIPALFTIGIFGSVIYIGCKNKCGSITCNNGGTCQSNVCVCPTGYYGNACQTAFITPLLGTYNCSRAYCTQYVGGVNAWQSVVSAASVNAGYTFVISNFNNTNTSITETVDSFGNITTDLANGESGISANGKFTPAATNVAPEITLSFQNFSVASGFTGAKCQMTMIKE